MDKATIFFFFAQQLAFLWHAPNIAGAL